MVWERCRSEARFQEIVKKYPIGTPAEVVLSEYAGRAKFMQMDIVLHEGASEDEKRRTAFSYVILTDGHIRVFFNCYQKVIRIDRSEQP
jgi:hypothetical protein